MSDEYVEEVQGYVNPNNVLDELTNIDDLSDEEVEEIEPNVVEDVLDDDIDDDNDADMANPLNMNSELDDINVELDEEEY